MNRPNVRMLAEAGMTLALAVILSEFVKLFEMPMGGSVTLGGMVPLFLFAFRWGGKKGMLVGAVFGILDLLIGGFYSMHPIAIILDYPLAFSVLGLAGFFKKSTIGHIGGIFTGIFARFICHVASGVLFYASYAPEGQAPLVYSIVYNGPYLWMELLITLTLALIILKFVKMPEQKSATKA